jgi:hypothetical protein
LDFEFYGTVYFCADCVGDYARAFGFISPVELEQIRNVVDAQALELRTLRAAILGMEATVDGLVGDAHRRSEQRASDIRNERIERDRKRDASDPVDEQDAGTPESKSPEADSTVRESADRPVKSSNKQGPDDLYSTNSADELLGLS